MATLPLRFERFCHEYVECGNAAEAYRRTIARSDLKASSVTATSCRLLARPEIQLRIMEIQAGLAEDFGIDLERIVAELEVIAFCDITDFFHDDGMSLTRKSWDDIPRRKLAAISEIKETVTNNGSTVTVKFHSKLDAQKELAKLLALYPKAGADEHIHYVVALPERATNALDWEKTSQETYARMQATKAREMAVDVIDLEPVVLVEDRSQR